MDATFDLFEIMAIILHGIWRIYGTFTDKRMLPDFPLIDRMCVTIGQ